MDLATLIALYPIAGELLRRAPQLQKWMERKARKEDPAFLLQLQSLEAITELKDGVSQLKDGVSQMKDGVSHLRSYTLNTAIMSAMLSNPDLSPADSAPLSARQALGSVDSRTGKFTSGSGTPTFLRRLYKNPERPQQQVLCRRSGSQWRPICSCGQVLDAFCGFAVADCCA